MRMSQYLPFFVRSLRLFLTADALYTTVESGKAVAITTGSIILNGADAVAMVEQTDNKKNNNNIVKIFKDVEHGKNAAFNDGILQ
jgi:molybdopterin biosynthesis enzyme